MPISITYTDAELQTIARQQKVLLWLVPLFTLSELVALANLSSPLFPMIQCVLLTVRTFLLYRFALSMSEPVPWIYALTGWIPIVGLLIAGVLNARATALLKAGGFSIGVLGASLHPTPKEGSWEEKVKAS